MNSVLLKVVMKINNVKMPKRSTEGSAGYDVFAHRRIVIPSRKVVSIKLPFKFEGELDEKMEVRMFVRSSFGIKKKFRLVQKSDKNIEYLTLSINDETHIINVINDSEKDLIIEKGEHFAQFLICDQPYRYRKIDVLMVPNEEKMKYNILKGKMENDNQVQNFILEEDLLLKANEELFLATGMRCFIEENAWAAITAHKEVRDRIMLSNQTAVIDRDYTFTKNYGHCFVGLVNLKDENVLLKKGTKLMSWWSESYYTLKDEIKDFKLRDGGIGSTNK